MKPEVEVISFPVGIVATDTSMGDVYSEASVAGIETLKKLVADGFTVTHFHTAAVAQGVLGTFVLQKLIPS